MIRIVNYAMLALLFALVASAYKVTYAVRRSEERIETLRAGITKERERLQVLQADWEYLNNPQALERWARKLALGPMSPAQVVAVEDLPRPDVRVRPQGRLVLAAVHEDGSATAPAPAAGSAPASLPAHPRPKPRFAKRGGGR